MRLKELFQNVYVINLDEDTARWQGILEQFRKHDLPAPRRFSAIRGATLDKDTLRRIRSKRRDASSFDSDGHIGCAMSHSTLWKDAVAQALPHITILEDDVTFTPSFSALLDVELPSDWDFLHLGHVRGNAYLKNARAMAPQPPYDAKMRGENFYEFDDPSDKPICGYAYACVPERIKNIIDVYDFQMNSDTYLATMCGHKKVYGLYPCLFVHSYEHGSHTATLNETDPLRQWVSYVTNYPRHLPFVIPWLVALGVISFMTQSFLWAMMWVVVLVARLVLDFRSLREKINRARKRYVNVPGFFGVHYFDPLGNVWDDTSKQQTLALLREVDAICSEHQIRYFVGFGTLLGWARHGKKLIPWDDDLDIAVDRRDLARLLTSLRTSKSLRIAQKWSIGCGFFYKVYSTNPDEIWPFIDIFPYDLDVRETRITWSSGHWAKPILLPSPLRLVDSDLETMRVIVPEQWQSVLECEYGTGWKQSCRSSTYCHRYEAEMDFRYSLTIDSKYLGLGDESTSTVETQ